jgi:hypothetical protein
MARIPRARGPPPGPPNNYYLRLNPEESRLDLPNAQMPPHFQAFAVDGKTCRLNHIDRMLDDRPHNTVLMALVGPAKRAGNPVPFVVKFADSRCKDKHVFLAKESLAPDLRYCERVECVGVYIVILDPAAEERPEPKSTHKPNILVTEKCDPKIIRF